MSDLILIVGALFTIAGAGVAMVLAIRKQYSVSARVFVTLAIVAFGLAVSQAVHDRWISAGVWSFTTLIHLSGALAMHRAQEDHQLTWLRSLDGDPVLKIQAVAKMMSGTPAWAVVRGNRLLDVQPSYELADSVVRDCADATDLPRTHYEITRIS